MRKCMFVTRILLCLHSVLGESQVKWGEWIPNAPAWRRRLDYRLEQVKRIRQSQERWDGLMGLAMTGLLVPNFTDIGYKVIPTPEKIHRLLNGTLYDALESGRIRNEGKVDQISGPRAQFVNLGRVRNDAMYGMQESLEAWSGIPLRASTAYGLRLYQEGNTLTMHTDRVESHVISCIVHVDRDVDEPWPIVIEGFDGRSVEVDLQPGQSLLYESAKAIHGRPRPMKGRWYTSLFVHFAPTTWSVATRHARDLVEPIFSTFHARPQTGNYAPLRLRGTGYYEPECEHLWCHLAPVWPVPLNTSSLNKYDEYPTKETTIRHQTIVTAPDHAGIFSGDEL